MAVCELPPLCSKSTPLKKTATTVACRKHPLSKKLPLLHVRSTPTQKKVTLHVRSTPSARKAPLSKKSPLLHVESTPSARKAPPLKKKSHPHSKKGGNFGGFLWEVETAKIAIG